MGGGARKAGAAQSATPWYWTDTFFDVAGWVSLAGSLVAYLAFAPKAPQAAPKM